MSFFTHKIKPLWHNSLKQTSTIAHLLINLNKEIYDVDKTSSNWNAFRFRSNNVRNEQV